MPTGGLHAPCKGMLTLGQLYERLIVAEIATGDFYRRRTTQRTLFS
jgi:hypothetical protein